jgi:hypothetical protein
VDQVQAFRASLLTCWPVITEAAYLLRSKPGAVTKLLEWFDEGVLEFVELDKRAPSWIGSFLGRYANLKPDLADGALVYLAEREGVSTVFTLDRRDFSVYRLSEGRALRILPEG